LFLNHSVRISGRFYEEEEKEKMFMSRGQMLVQRGRDVCISQAQMLDGNLVYWMFNIDNIGM